MPKRRRALITRARRRALSSPRIPESLFDRMSDEVLEDDGLVKQVVKIRKGDERNAMTTTQRMKMRLSSLISRDNSDENDESDSMDETPTSSDSSDVENGTGDRCFDFDKFDKDNIYERQQFTVVSKKSTFLQKLKGLNHEDFLYSPSKLFCNYINWTFKAGFATVFLSFLILFMVLIFVFGVLMKWAGEAHPSCIVVAGDEFGKHSGTTLADGFHLSWTTFTTVGYGAVYTATGNDHTSQGDCSFIVFLSTAESFIGLLYAGMCAAILFGKVGRVQSHAQVIFSDAICVEYGVELDEEENYVVHNIDASKDAEDGDVTPDGTHPLDTPQTLGKVQILCPTISIQVVNNLSNEVGGEIFDCHLNVLASLKPKGESDSVAKYFNVPLKESMHPFFDRVWHVRHVLNENSPLLSMDTRNEIRLNNGLWPAYLNSAQSIRDRLLFTDLIVTLTGISNISSESVFTAKKYKKSHIVVGYEFAPLFYMKPTMKKLFVDMSLVNDVVEQSGTEKSSNFSDNEESIKIVNSSFSDRAPSN